MPKYLTEFVGTALFVLIIAMAVRQNLEFAPVAIGVGLMCLVYMGGHISGAHYNPAVTIALVLRGAHPARQAVPYIIFQCLGAFAGAGVAKALVDGRCAPGPGEGQTLAGVFVAEVIFTMMLALTVIQTAASKATKGNSFYGLAIGGVLVVAAVVIGPVSGAAINPAVAIGTLVVDTMAGGSSIGNLWVYLVATVLGGVLAAGVARLQGE